MIIKGVFKRYQRWNPVHPTYGAFWGLGIGIGCGVGWGPGFGPEVIGYVGAGCGVGFSVGFTTAGFGIGLPANYLFGVPYNAFMATRSGVLDIAKSNRFLSSKNVAGDGWSITLPHVSDLQREASERLASFKPKVLLEEGLRSYDMKSLLPLHGNSVWESVGEFHKKLFRGDKGMLR
ncbi:hypothetical protein TIFTF001_009992 [Ficus carica]|uniref:Cadmium-induced protein AS8 n=1 Tax=Ficus carica TaxID=3494 RepID=A0AA88D431_FICCA|nr:hypothetical protein TIFTF001_009992 [Ficus carica]